MLLWSFRTTETVWKKSGSLRLFLKLSNKVNNVKASDLRERWSGSQVCAGCRSVLLLPGTAAGVLCRGVSPPGAVFESSLLCLSAPRGFGCCWQVKPLSERLTAASGWSLRVWPRLQTRSELSGSAAAVCRGRTRALCKGAQGGHSRPWARGGRAGRAPSRVFPQQRWGIAFPRSAEAHLWQLWCKARLGLSPPLCCTSTPGAARTPWRPCGVRSAGCAVRGAGCGVGFGFKAGCVGEAGRARVLGGMSPWSCRSLAGCRDGPPAFLSCSQGDGEEPAAVSGEYRKFGVAKG